MGVWFFAELARQCRQRLERLFYCIGMVDCIILSALAVIPMSTVATWVFYFLNVGLCATEIALSAAVILWHSHVRTREPDSQQ